jgi:membrane-associated protease RseP (regulator of RpoE activity)
MKTPTHFHHAIGRSVLLFLSVLLTSTASNFAGGLKLAADAAAPEPPTANAEAVADVNVEADAEAEATSSRKEVSWLGISTVEATEALASQLDLEPGVGLVVTYVAPDSPAAKAGLKKNDLLTRFEDQSLVHPAQLKKLVRVRENGSPVKLEFFRGGKRETISVTLGKRNVEPGQWEQGERALRGTFKELNKQFQQMHLDDTVRDQMRVLRETLGNIKIDQREVQDDIRRGMDQARVTIRDALRNITNSDTTLAPLRKVLENLAHTGVVVDDKADVVVRSSGKNTKTMVRSDESGTIVLFSNPSLHLTAHDKDGKLIFDGPIETIEERAKVPRDPRPSKPKQKSNKETHTPRQRGTAASPFKNKQRNRLARQNNVTGKLASVDADGALFQERQLACLLKLRVLLR